MSEKRLGGDVEVTAASILRSDVLDARSEKKCEIVDGTTRSADRAIDAEVTSLLIDVPPQSRSRSRSRQPRMGSRMRRLRAQVHVCFGWRL